MPPRLIADELDLDLPALAAALLVIVVVVLGAGPLSLDATGFVGRGGIAVSDRVRLGDVGGRRLVVLIGDVAHGCFFIAGCQWC